MRVRAPRIRVWAILLLALPFGCGDPAPAPTPRNVLLISIDALRADRLGSYGYPRPTSPFLDELAAGGTRFSNAFVNTLATPPSHATIFSGHYQETHRVVMRKTREPWMTFRFPRTLVPIQERLGHHGYETVAVTEGVYMDAIYGWGRGFDAFNDQARDIASGADALAGAIARRRTSPRPIFAFLHTYEVHLPYVPPAKYREQFSDHRGDWVAEQGQLQAIWDSPGGLQFLSEMYDGEIRFTDDTLRALFARLEAEGFLDDALIVITSDHGEEFGEHGGISHGGSLYEELVKVPLIVLGPGIPAGVVDDRMVSSIDILPTILGRLGLPVEAQLPGIDLFDPAAAPRESVFLQYRDEIYGVRTRRWKWIERSDPSGTKLFDLEADPGETKDLTAEEPEQADAMREALAAWRRGVWRIPEREPVGGRAPPGPSPAHRERLRALGYGD